MADPVTVTGRVVDKTGTPIAGAEIHLSRWAGPGINLPVTTGQDGKFTYPDVEPLANCAATGDLSTPHNAFIARVRVGTDYWPEIPLCIEPNGSATIDKGDLSRGHFIWANHIFHLYRDITEDHAEGNQNFTDSWQLGIGNDPGGPIDWEIKVETQLPTVYDPTSPQSGPNFSWSGSLPADQYFNYADVGLVDSVPFPTAQPLGFEVTRSSNSVIPAHATVQRSWTLSVTTIEALPSGFLYGQVRPYYTPIGPVSVSDFGCTGDGTVNPGYADGAPVADWSVTSEPGGQLVPGTYRLTCTITVSNAGGTAAIYKPWTTIQAMGPQLNAQAQNSTRYVGISSLKVFSPDLQVEPRDRLGFSTFIVKEPAENPGNGLFVMDFTRWLCRRIVFMSANESLPKPVATNPDQCKKDGWKELYRADGTSFKNQGDCVSYSRNGK